MLGVLQVVSVIFVVLAMVPALAHALELPGKMRLSKDAYFAVQPIYFPGFTIMGLSEPVVSSSPARQLLAGREGSFMKNVKACRKELTLWAF